MSARFDYISEPSENPNFSEGKMRSSPCLSKKLPKEVKSEE